MFGHSTPATLYDADPQRRESSGADFTDTIGTAHLRAVTQTGQIPVVLPQTRADSGRAYVDAPCAESALLVARRGPNAGFRCRLDRNVITVGRHPDSDVVLDAVTVSPRHAEFRRDDAEFVVADVGSFNGTYVNGTPVDVAALADGDEVQIGKFRLVFRAGHPARGADAPPTPLIPAGPETGPTVPPSSEGSVREMSTREPLEPEQGGDPLCRMHLLCPECGQIADEEPPTYCRSCRALIPGD